MLVSYKDGLVSLGNALMNFALPALQLLDVAANGGQRAGVSWLLVGCCEVGHL